MKPIHATRPGSGATASVAGLKPMAHPHPKQQGSGATAKLPD